MAIIIQKPEDVVMLLVNMLFSLRPWVFTYYSPIDT